MELRRLSSLSILHPLMSSASETCYYLCRTWKFIISLKRGMIGMTISFSESNGRIAMMGTTTALVHSTHVCVVVDQALWISTPLGGDPRPYVTTKHLTSQGV